MEYKEFVTKVIKREGKKVMKVSGSWGVYDAYKYIRKNGWFDIGRCVTEHEFYSIIRGVNKLLAEEFATKGRDIHFPYAMGHLEIRKQKRGVFFDKDGKFVNSYPIDWCKTLRLWYEDKEAMRDKVLIRHEVEYLPIVYYNKYYAFYKNQRFYEFDVNRFMGKAVYDNIMKGKIDILW